MDAASGNGRTRWYIPALLVGGGYLLLTLWHCRRVVAHLGSQLAGHGGDGWQNLWNMWWLQRALEQGVSPYFTPLLHHPHGHSLLFHTFNPFNGMLALPLESAFGQPAAYNLVFLFSFVASGLTMYLLARELNCSRTGAFLAGCLFTFSPFHFAHAQGHLQLVALEWLPLFLLFARRLWFGAGPAAALGTGLCLGLTTLCSHYYALAGVVSAAGGGLLLAWRQPQRLRQWSLWRDAALAGLLFLAAGGAVALAMALRLPGAGLAPAHDSVYWSADLQSFWVPSWILASGDWFVSISSRWTGNSAECSQYLGYLALGLAVLALARPPAGRRRPWAWLALLLAGMVLGLGPYLHLGGRVLRSVPLPFALLERVVPGLALSGAPVRWHVLVLVALPLLAGLGLSALAAHIRHWPAWRRQVLVGAACCLAVLEYWPRPVETRPLLQPGFCRQLAAAGPAGEAVYDLGDGNRALLRQTCHGRPLVGGYLARVEQRALDFVKHHPLLRALRGEIRLPPEQVSQLAAGLRLRHLLVPRGRSWRLPRLGLQRRAQTGNLEWWVIPW